MMQVICLHLLAVVKVLLALPPPYVVGGTPANISDFPYQVSVGIDDIGHICGGSIISENAILTAAHCCIYTWRHKYRIIAGATDLNDPEEGFQNITVKAYTHHPGYHGNGDYQHDVCVMKLKSKLVISPQARTAMIALPGDGYKPKGRTVIGGWGFRQPHGKKSHKFIAANVTIFNDDYCYKKYGQRFKKNSMLCGGSEEGGTDSCQGDSGGAMVDSDGNQVGLTSWGVGCGHRDYPGVYARVSLYSKWIKSQLSA